jgi:7-keto-8-aminopelargonate synthetase-like enzyme
MARVNHNNYLDTIDNLFTDAKNRGIMHLNTNSNNCGGGYIETNEQSMINFGTCGYMALEYDKRLINGAIEYVKKFGTQFSVSRAYISSGINVELEDKLSKIYNLPVIAYSSTSTAHISVIPSLVRDRDAIILDQQVHFSVQTGANLLRQKNIPIEMIRHSNMEMLEKYIQQLGNKFEKIWYMIDGVYSMFGDVAPVEELKYLLNKYHNFYLYVDDAHGMSWYGKNGAGYFFDKMGSHPKVVLITTLAKGFGTMGGLAIFSDHEMYRKTKIFGGPLSYSHPLAPSLIGSSMASANIHLSDEIYSIQNELKELKDCCNETLNELDLPVLSNPETPIYFVGMGLPKVGYNILNKIIKDGFFANVAIFPAVSVKNTGLRFTITRHQNKGEIVKFIETIRRNFEIVLKEEDITENEIRKLFRLPQKKEKQQIFFINNSPYAKKELN